MNADRFAARDRLRVGETLVRGIGDPIETPRLLLRPMVPADADALLPVFGDPIVMAVFDRGPFTEEEMQAWVERNLEHQRLHGFGLFTVIEKASRSVIGDCGLEATELRGRRAVELGYDLRSDRWGHGFATEAARAVVGRASACGIEHLVSMVRVGNDRSARVARRVGMTLLDEVDRGGIAYWVFALEPHRVAASAS